MTRPVTTQLTAALLALLVLTAGATAPALAQSADDEEEDIDWSERISSVFGDGASIAEATQSIVGGMVSNAMYRAERFGDHDPKRTPSECAGDIRSEVNNHSTAYEDYLNQRVNATAAVNVIEIRCTYDDGESVASESVYLVADVTNSSYKNLTATVSTNRTVDETFVLTGKATEELPDEPESFRSTYVAENTTPPQSYKPGLVTKYGGYVYGTPSFLPPIDEAHDDTDGGDA